MLSLREIFHALYKKKQNKTVNCCKKEQGMSDVEHSESDFYYPEEGNLNVSLQNEKLEASEVFKASEVLKNNEYKNISKCHIINNLLTSTAWSLR